MEENIILFKSITFWVFEWKKKSKYLHLFLLQSSFFLETASYFYFFVGFKKTIMSVIAEVFINNSTLNCAAMLQ